MKRVKSLITGNNIIEINLGEVLMDIIELKNQVSKLNLKNFKLIQIKSNRLLLLNSRYKFSDCIYINLYKNKAEIIHDRVFDNKWFYKDIERLLISRNYIDGQENIIKYLDNILNAKYIIKKTI